VVLVEEPNAVLDYESAIGGCVRRWSRLRRRGISQGRTESPVASARGVFRIGLSRGGTLPSDYGRQPGRAPQPAGSESWTFSARRAGGEDRTPERAGWSDCGRVGAVGLEGEWFHYRRYARAFAAPTVVCGRRGAVSELAARGNIHPGAVSVAATIIRRAMRKPGSPAARLVPTQMNGENVAVVRSCGFGGRSRIGEVAARPRTGGGGGRRKF